MALKPPGPKDSRRRLDKERYRLRELDKKDGGTRLLEWTLKLYEKEL